MLKKISVLEPFYYFYKFLGKKIFTGLLLSFLVAIFDGFALTMIFPLFQTLNHTTEITSQDLGTLSFIGDLLHYFGVSLQRNNILFFMLILFTLKGITKFIEGYYNIKIQQLFIVKLRKELISQIAGISYKNFIKSDSGRIQNTLSGEVTRVVNAYRSYFSTIQNLVFVLIFITLAFIANPQFAAIVSVGGVMTSLIFSFLYKKTKKISISLTSESHLYQGYLIQAILFFKYLKATGRFNKYANKLEEAIDVIEKDNKTLGKIQTFLIAVREPIIIYIVALAIMIQFVFFSNDFTLILLSLMFFWRALNFLIAYQTSWNGFLSVSGSMKNMTDFSKNLIENAETYGHQRIVCFQNQLALSDIGFFYEHNDPILKNINLSIKKNTTIAFIGESGSGKTTLVNILTGLLPINCGSYQIDGIETKEIDMRTFQNRIGYITQEPVIFDDNVFNNVTFWDEKTTENVNRFWDALRKASILDFVESLPEKENAPLGNNGIMVSGGQKQRLSIARELYKDIDILIMDEATSALDSETEKSIQENIDALKGQYTIIIIAHRLSTIKNADEIVLMGKGEIIDKGSFSELIGSNETFKRMVNLQEL